MRSRPLLGSSLSALVPALLVACQATPPAAGVETSHGAVRAATAERAEEVATMLDALLPRVTALVPDSRERPLEVWVQAKPRLYRFWTTSDEEADGFWAEGPGRIHLRETGGGLERTLAHELVHATLGESWRRLPGTLEEGVCDWVSARLCPLNASRLRAGRLSAACFATGGMELDVDLLVPGPPDTLAIEIGYSASVLLRSEEEVPIDPSRVFEVRAGMSDSGLSSTSKKAYYGIAFLLVDRITERSGLQGLHELCRRAQARGMDEVPAEWFLAAAGLEGADTATWRAAIHDALDARDLREMLAMYPALLTDTLDRIGGVEFPGAHAARVQARIAVGGTDEGVELQLVLEH
ncbi:MAG: hypothetical protein CMJ84_03530 [Planctomycetes bacterium]|nr:hypothetical protein [Planctomycetota bacterium]